MRILTDGWHFAAEMKETFHLPAARAKVRRVDRSRHLNAGRGGALRDNVDGKHFGNRLREARLQAGFSQSELEDLSGIPKARLSRYENGHVEPSIQTLARLARALNVSEASLLGDQRATLEGFFDVLSSRGVRIESAEQGARLANAVADMVAGARRHAVVRRRRTRSGSATDQEPTRSTTWADAGEPAGADVS